MPAGVAEYSSTGTRVLALGDIRPRPNLVLAIEVKEERTSQGLILPDVGDAQKVRIAYCFARGAGLPDKDGGELPKFIKPGMFFFFGKHQSGGEAMKIGDVSVLMFNDNDTMGEWTAPDDAARAYVDSVFGAATKLRAVA